MKTKKCVQTPPQIHLGAHLELTLLLGDLFHIQPLNAKRMNLNVHFVLINSYHCWQPHASKLKYYEMTVGSPLVSVWSDQARHMLLLGFLEVMVIASWVARKRSGIRVWKCIAGRNLKFEGTSMRNWAAIQLFTKHLQVWTTWSLNCLSKQKYYNKCGTRQQSFSNFNP